MTDRQQATENVAQAEELYRQREDLSKLRQAVTLLRQARIGDYGNYEIAWKLAKFDYYLGSHTDDDRERDEAFREGIEAAKTAVQIYGDKPDGHFWLGANYGGTAEHSIVAGLATIEDIRREMEAVLKIDEGYQSGSAYLGLGQLYLQAPKILGGDTQKAISYLEKGLKFGSNNALLRLRLAEAYEAAHRDAEARREIDFLLRMTPHPDYVPEHNEAVGEARKLLKKMDENRR
ncbi:MAG TPA: TRAP transporter TatT component family protein [Pyrinomonadaceae bacterium]|nr:TRAP transporter TatT component family protein [Pyrinomonadaceae bacterium]